MIAIKKNTVKKVGHYIEPSTLMLYRKLNKGTHGKYSTQMEKVSGWVNKHFRDIPIDHLVLSCIMIELLTDYKRVQDDKMIRAKISPYFYNGASDFLDLLKMVKKKDFIVEKIKIYTKQKSIPDKSAQSSKQKTIYNSIEIMGSDITSLIFESVRLRKERLKGIAGKEKENVRVLSLRSYIDPRNYFKIKSAKILEKYFRDHIPDFSHNTICLLGGNVLHYMGLFNYRSHLKKYDNASNRSLFISNFKMALKGKLD